MEAIENLLKMSHRVSKHTVGAEGNTSVRVDDCFYIKASGCSLEDLNESQIIKCDLDGNQINNFHLKPSLETGFHSLLYKETGCNYVAHTHPTETLKILCSDRTNEFANERIFPDQVVYNGLESCVVEYAHPGDDLKESIRTSLNKFFYEKSYFPSLILLQNHGIICIDETMRNCIFSTDICEKSASIFLSGNITFLSQQSKDRIFNDKKEKYRKNRK
tara:strand:+ start:1516 stop:2169 length:654 start_codon:yes stop_codon:yes gene_type:complete